MWKAACLTIKGHKSGMPSIPILFNIVLELLSRHLLANSAIRGVLMVNVDVKTALFADDIIHFFCHNLQKKAILVVQEICMEYVKFSSLWIHFLKSEILPLAKSRHRSWVSDVPFVVASDHVTYLGIKAPIFNLSLKFSTSYRQNNKGNGGMGRSSLFALREDASG